MYKESHGPDSDGAEGYNTMAPHSYSRANKQTRLMGIAEPVYFVCTRLVRSCKRVAGSLQVNLEDGKQLQVAHSTMHVHNNNDNDYYLCGVCAPYS